MVKMGEGRLVKTDCPALMGLMTGDLTGETGADMTVTAPAFCFKATAVMGANLLWLGGDVTLTARPICSEKSRVTGWPVAERGANCRLVMNCPAVAAPEGDTLTPTTPTPAVGLPPAAGLVRTMLIAIQTS